VRFAVDDEPSPQVNAAECVSAAPLSVKPTAMVAGAPTESCEVGPFVETMTGATLLMTTFFESVAVAPLLSVTMTEMV
jgi:hypothetical protein